MAYELFLESFDTWRNSKPSKWISLSGNTTAGSGRRSSNGFSMLNTTYTRTKLFTPSKGVVVGFALKRLIMNEFRVFFWNDVNTVYTVYINTSNKIYVTINGTTYTSDYSITQDAWYFIEIGAYIDDVNGHFEVRVNGSSTGWIKVSNFDSKGSYNTIDNIVFHIPNTAASHVLEDLYITYGDELKWLGDIRVDALTLDGNATPQDWTPDSGNDWERLNQTAGNVKSNIVNAESLFSVANLSFDTAEVHGVQIEISALKTDAGQRNIVIEANNNITVSSNTIALGTSNTEYTYSLTKDTNGNDWTKEAVNNLKVGIKVVE